MSQGCECIPLKWDFGGLGWQPAQACASGKLCDASAEVSLSSVWGLFSNSRSHPWWPTWQLCLEPGFISLTGPPDFPFCLQLEPALHYGCIGWILGSQLTLAAAHRAALLTLLSHGRTATASLLAVLWLSLLGLQSPCLALLLLSVAVGKVETSMQL